MYIPYFKVKNILEKQNFKSAQELKGVLTVGMKIEFLSNSDYYIMEEEPKLLEGIVGHISYKKNIFFIFHNDRSFRGSLPCDPYLGDFTDDDWEKSKAKYRIKYSWCIGFNSDNKCLRINKSKFLSNYYPALDWQEKVESEQNNNIIPIKG